MNLPFPVGMQPLSRNRVDFLASNFGLCAQKRMNLGGYLDSRKLYEVEAHLGGFLCATRFVVELFKPLSSGERKIALRPREDSANRGLIYPRSGLDLFLSQTEINQALE